VLPGAEDADGWVTGGADVGVCESHAGRVGGGLRRSDVVPGGHGARLVVGDFGDGGAATRSIGMWVPPRMTSA